MTGRVEKAQQGLADLTQSLGEESDQAEKGRKGNWEVVWGGITDSGNWWEVHRLAPAGTAEF